MVGRPEVAHGRLHVMTPSYRWLGSPCVYHLVNAVYRRGDIYEATLRYSCSGICPDPGASSASCGGVRRRRGDARASHVHPGSGAAHIYQSTGDHGAFDFGASDRGGNRYIEACPDGDYAAQGHTVRIDHYRDRFRSAAFRHAQVLYFQLHRELGADERAGDAMANRGG